MELNSWGRLLLRHTCLWLLDCLCIKVGTDQNNARQVFRLDPTKSVDANLLLRHAKLSMGECSLSDERKCMIIHC